MRKIVFLFVLIATTVAQTYAQKNGDSLCILYQRVWAYENPNNIATRLGPYYYSQKKMVFIEESTSYPGYVKVITPDKKTAFIKRKLLAENTKISKKEIWQDIEEGKRFKSQYMHYKTGIIDFRGWESWLVALLIYIALYYLWKNFFRIDNWFYKKSQITTRIKTKPRFISYSAILGMIVGSFYTLFAPTETEWFLYEGIHLWADYPTSIDWILWASIWLFAITIIAGIVSPFFRFRKIYRFIYAVINLVLMIVYFMAGVLSGGLVAILIILYLFVSGSSGSSSSNSGGSSGYSEPSGTIKTVNGQRLIKTDSGRWDNF